jgi:predicted nucleotidyltransferase
MKREDVISKLKTVEPAIRAHGVSSLYIYGSYARDEARPDSDVDVFVEFDDATPLNFADYMDVYHIVQEAVGVEVDYGTRAGIVEFYRPTIETESIRVF